MAECSESIGRSQASGLAYGSPGRIAAATPRRSSRASGMTRWPPATSVSLLAVATTLPARSAARTGRRLTTPPVADDDEVDVVAGRQLLERVRAADAFRAGRQVQPGERRAVAERDGRRPEARGLLGEESGVRPPVARATTRNASGCAVEDVDRLAADRAGRAEERDAARPVPRSGVSG